MTHNATIENETLQDQAEAYWRRLAPELVPDLLTHVAFHFGTRRRFATSARKKELAKEVNAVLGREAFRETQFGDLVFVEE